MLEPLARPEPLDDLDRLIAELRGAPQAVGPGGTAFLARLDDLPRRSLYGRTLGARALIDALENGVADDSLTPAFRDRALPVLQALAQQPAA